MRDACDQLASPLGSVQNPSPWMVLPTLELVVRTSPSLGGHLQAS